MISLRTLVDSLLGAKRPDARPSAHVRPEEITCLRIVRPGLRKQPVSIRFIGQGIDDGPGR
jgi:hypothetical protein